LRAGSRVAKEFKTLGKSSSPIATAAKRIALSPQTRLGLAETNNAQRTIGSQGDGDVDRILKTIRARDSGGRYDARNPASTAAGAYQFTDPTWQRLTHQYGVGTEYAHADRAPPAVQDAVARRYASDTLRENGGDVSKVPLVWYTGNPAGHISRQALAANNGLTPGAYQNAWMHTYQHAAATGGRIERATGGRAQTINHGQAAESLIRAAERAKKQQGKTTEPLLSLPDETIVKALSIANRSV
jgi:hypothetical protein